MDNVLTSEAGTGRPAHFTKGTRRKTVYSAEVISEGNVRFNNSF
jgi:hypothetical protein